MSVFMAAPEGLAGPRLPEDQLSGNLHGLQLGQEDGALQMRQNGDVDKESESGSEAEDSSLHSSESRRNPCTDGLIKRQRSAGVLEYGCAHYRRRCRLRAPCCGEVFACRHCHNDARNANEGDPKKRHDLPRHLVESVICSICGTEQRAQQICQSCGVCMGEYFCGKCRFYDDNTTKEQYHCDECGICRIGGRDKFFHCRRCGCCYSILLKKGHPCVENSMHHNCPVCFEYLFDSMKDITVMQCGHTMHLECFKEMQKHSQYSCPMCSKSICDMRSMWEQLDQEIAATPMPEAYQNKMVWILCNDCGVTSQVSFHIIAHKCNKCNSYNTRQTQSGCHSRNNEDRPDL